MSYKETPLAEGARFPRSGLVPDSEHAWGSQSVYTGATRALLPTAATVHCVRGDNGRATSRDCRGWGSAVCSRLGAVPGAEGAKAQRRRSRGFRLHRGGGEGRLATRAPPRGPPRARGSSSPRLRSAGRHASPRFTSGQVRTRTSRRVSTPRPAGGTSQQAGPGRGRSRKWRCTGVSERPARGARWAAVRRRGQLLPEVQECPGGLCPRGRR